MATISGVVTNLNAETKTSAAGKRFQIHSFEVDGVWYECGFKQISKVGDTCTFDYELSYGKNKVTDGTYRKGSAAATGASVVASSAPPRSGASGKAFPVPKNSGERAILRQNALTHARELLHASGYYDQWVGKGVAEADLDVMAAMTISLATRFEDYTSGDMTAAIEHKAEHEGIV